MPKTLLKIPFPLLFDKKFKPHSYFNGKDQLRD